MRFANLLATTSRSRSGGERQSAEDAKDTDPDECAVGQRDQRHQRGDGDGDPACDRGRRTGPGEVGTTGRPENPGQQGTNRQKLTRQLAPGISVRPRSGTGDLQGISGAHRGM